MKVFDLYGSPSATSEEAAVQQKRLERLLTEELASLHVASANSIIVSTLECDLVALPGKVKEEEGIAFKNLKLVHF